VEAHESYKATIRIGDKSITFEGPKEFVEEQVAKYTALPSSKQQAIVPSHGGPAASQVTSEQAFIETKRPRSHPETIAVLAFYLAENGHEEFTEDHILQAYRRAVIRPPRVAAQAIRDAKSRYGYVEKDHGVGHTD
jgi:hypothetical protein